MPALKIENLSKRFSYDKFFLFENLSFCVEEGQTATLMLDIQSGKSTLAKIICGVIKPTDGKIYLSQPRQTLYLTGAPLFFERQTLLKNLLYPAKVRKIPAQQARQSALEAAQKYNLTHFLDQKAKNLTNEQRFFSALARACVRPVNLVIADGLNSAQNALAAEFCAQNGCALLVLTPEINELRGNTYIFHGGKIIYEGGADGARKAIEKILWLNSARNIAPLS